MLRPRGESARGELLNVVLRHRLLAPASCCQSRFLFMALPLADADMTKMLDTYAEAGQKI